MERCNSHIFKDERGSLVSWQSNKEIPFSIKRVYCVYGVAGKSRGMHAHKTDEIVMVCLTGSCTVVLNDGAHESVNRLDNPSDGLYVGSRTWLEMRDFSDGAILLVLSSSLYDETDYIRELDQLVKEKAND